VREGEGGLAVFYVGMGKGVFSSSAEDLLCIQGLGSCIGLALYDPRGPRACLCHIVLPEGGTVRPDGPGNPAKYADLGVEWAVEEMRRLGAVTLQAKMAGGASLLRFPSSPLLRVGERNVEAVRKALVRFGIPLLGEDVGGEEGRSVTFRVADGRMEVRYASGRVLVL